MSTTATPPGMIRMGNRFVPVSKPFGSAKMKTKRFLVCLQFYEGDRDAAEELASLIADLERTRNHTADILLMRRGDSRELSTAVKAKLAAKFGMVHQHACRRSDARSYPHGSNQMFFDLITLMAYPPYVDDYFAFINLETDVVPTRPGWSGELIKAWETKAADKLAIGYIHDNPVPHLNGVAVYAANFQRAVARGQLRGANPQIAYDINHSPSILPVAAATPLIHFSYRQPTVTRDELFAPRKDGVVPAVYHGVKDQSARALVRARHITFTDIAPVVAAPVKISELLADKTPHVIDKQAVLEQMMQVDDDITLPNPAPTRRENVYTYFSARGRQSAESQAVLDLWRKGWTSCGWNPIILTLRDAAKHPKFDDFSAAVEKFPCAMDRQRTAHQFNRWLALELAGGGLLVDCDVLPEDFTPAAMADWHEIHAFREGGGRLFGAFMEKARASAWLDQVIAYDAQPDDKFGAKPDVTDDTILRRQADAVNETASGLVHFSGATVGNERKSVAMEKFLQKVPV